jgi:hypothetical protein
MTTDKCILYGSCKCQTAGCVAIPDRGCPVYRYFESLIDKWISVTDSLPEPGVDVLFCDIEGDVMLGHHVDWMPRTHFIEKGSWDTVKNVMVWKPVPKYEVDTD